MSEVAASFQTRHRPAERALDGPPVTIVSAVPTTLDAGKGLRREPVRPAAFRINGFDEQFDTDTLFYDAFLAPTGTHAVIVGPPLLNLRPLLDGMKVVALPSGVSCGFCIKAMDRHAQIRVAVPRGTDRLEVSSALGDFEIVPRDNLCSQFAGRRVLFTLSKNNRLEFGLARAFQVRGRPARARGAQHSRPDV